MVDTSTSARRASAIVISAALLIGVVGLLGAPSPARGASELFFSEYVEGSSNNKALEIYNGTGADVDLVAGGYNVQMFFNAGTSAGVTINLGDGTAPDVVADGDVYVVAQALASFAASADQTNASGWFNGDDAVVLRRGTTVIDVIGQVGFDPGTEWGTSATSTADNTLRRKATITAGDAVGSDAFDPATEWDGFATDMFGGLGAHTVAGETTAPAGAGAATPSSVLVGDTTLLTVDVTPGANPTSSGLTVTADLTEIGGPASQRMFDDGTNGDVTAGDLRFGFSATVGAVEAGAKTIPITIVDAQARDATAEIDLVVEGEPTEIWEIQGAAHRSTYEGELVFGVEGIVTARRNGGSGGFWMTDPTPDTGPGSELTSNGIFVFNPGTQTVAVGSHVRVSGTAAEFSFETTNRDELTITQLRSPTVTTLPTPTATDLPTTVIGVDRVPPGLIIEDDSTTTVEATGVIFDPANDGIDFWESLEGMRLSVADAVAVGPRNNFGEIAVVSKLTDAGLRTPRGGILVRGLGEPGDYRAGDFNPERLILDDVLSSTPNVNTRDEFVTDPVGVLDYSFGNFKLWVTANPGRASGGLQPEVTAPNATRELTVSTFNVENLSPRSPATLVAKLGSQIVDNLGSPDIIAIEEVQDNNGTTNDGTVAADQSWARLIAAIEAAGGPTYEYRQIDPLNNADGGAPGGNIRVGFLFREQDGLTFVDRPGGDATTDTNVVRRLPHADGDEETSSQGGGVAELTISPGRILPDPTGPWASAFDQTRKSLVGEFRYRGQTVFVVVNHLSSKGDDQPLFGQFQPPDRFTEFQSRSGTPAVEDGWRHAQAQVVNDFVDEILAVEPNANVIVLGDINDFDFSETVDVLTGERVALNPGPSTPDPDGSGQTAPSAEKRVLTTLFDLLPADERYSYVFDGNSQVLDQILVSSSILRKEPSYDVVHVNAEFFDQASDHDPSVMRVRLGAAN